MSAEALQLLYEDDALVVLCKPAGLSSETDVPAMLRERWGKPNGYVGIIHRLDMPVSGVMVYAKTQRAAAALSSQAAHVGEGGLYKEYRAVFAYKNLPERGVLIDYLFRDGRTGRVYPVSRPRKGVRQAVLAYQLLAHTTAPDGTPMAAAAVVLGTGRTHQIRAQFAARQCPLFGDGKYGSRQKGPIGLYSCRLAFTHPDSGERMSFELPPPKALPWTLFSALPAPDEPGAFRAMLAEAMA